MPEISISIDQLYQLMQLLNALGLNEYLVAALLKDEPRHTDESINGSLLAWWWVKQLKRKLAEMTQSAPVDLVSGMFTPLNQQVNNLRLWMGDGIYFSDRQINKVAAALPDFSWDQSLVVPVLCWTMSTLQQTIDTKLQLAALLYGQKKLYVPPDLRTDAEHLLLPEGAPEFEPNRLWWEIIDLGANCKTPATEVDPKIAAGIQMFDVVLQHRAYVIRQNGRNIPYTDIPGLWVVTGQSRPFVMCIYGYLDGCVRIRAYPPGANPKCAEPVVLSRS